MIDRTFQGFNYVIASDGSLMRDENAPRPPNDLLERWRMEAREDHLRAIVAEFRKEMALTKRENEDV